MPGHSGKPVEVRARSRTPLLVSSAAVAAEAPVEDFGVRRELDDRRHAEAILRRQKALLDLLRSIAVASNEASEAEPAIRRCLAEICGFVGWPIGHAYFPRDGDAEVLAPSTLWHLDDPERFEVFRQITEATELRRGQELIGRVFESGRAEWITDISADPEFRRGRWSRDLGVRAALAFPILIGGKPAGVLECFSSEAVDPDEDLLQVLGDIGTQIGWVLERERAGRELAKARDAALEASLLKSAFLANMSHEIRTPLNVILGYNAIIADRFPADGPEHSLLDGVERAGHRLMRTIHSILDLSKIETRTFHLEPSALDLGALTQRQVQELEPAAREKGLRLRYEIEEPEAAVFFDEYCLSHSLANLLENAIKFTSEGEVGVRIYRDSDWTLCLEVRDSGVGIDDSFLPHVFSPFSQEESGYTRRFEGAGLGLALSKKYLELNDASLRVESAKGRGSTFTIRFSKGSELWVTEGDSHARPGSAQDADRPLVLLVEDDPDTLTYMSALLSERYRLLEAHSTAEARQKLSEHGDEVQMILMDLSLRGPEDGLALTHELKSEARWKKLPILAVTAHAFAEDRARALAAGCDGFLAKPFQRSELFLLMANLLSPSELRPQWTPPNGLH